MNKTTASYYFQRFHQLIYDHSAYLELLEDEMEVDKNYFDGKCKGKRGRGASDNAPVIDLIVLNADFKENRIRLTLKMQREPFFQVTQRQLQKRSQGKDTNNQPTQIVIS